MLRSLCVSICQGNMLKQNIEAGLPRNQNIPPELHQVFSNYQLHNVSREDDPTTQQFKTFVEVAAATSYRFPWPRRQIWTLCDNQPSIGAMHFWHKCDGLVDWIPAWLERVRKEHCRFSCGVDCAKRGCRHLHHARVLSAADSSKRPHGECVGKFGCGVATVAQHQKHQAAILEECNYTPYRCTQCGLWHAACHFATTHQNPRWSVYRVCLSCDAKKQCFLCGTKAHERTLQCCGVGDEETETQTLSAMPT